MRPTLCHEAMTEGYPEWEAVSDRSGLWPNAVVLPCPYRWVDRYAIWRNGGSVRLMDRVPFDDKCPPEPTRRSSDQMPNPDDPALQITFAGWEWVFSHRALYQACVASKAWQVGTIYGVPIWADWLNGFPGTKALDSFYPCPSPFPGLWAVSNGEAVIGLHPLIAGPVIRMYQGASEWAPGLVGKQDGRFRGEQLPMGIRRGTGVEPVVAEGGWFRLASRYENRRL